MVKTLAAYVVGISAVVLLVGCGGSGGSSGGGQIRAIAGLPAGASMAMILGATQYQQVGLVEKEGIQQGAIFYGNPSAPVILESPNFIDLTLVATDDQHQVGNGIPANSSSASGHALLLSGTGQSAIDLHPAGFFYSLATGVSGSQQVGYGSLTDGGPDHPLLWTGNASSVVDLLPAGASRGRAYGVRNGVQGGYATLAGSKAHAAIWHGAASSFQDVNPEGFQISSIRGISNKDYVGSGLPTGAAPVGQISPAHALRWVGIKATDLNPAGVLASFASASDGSTQVGSFIKDSSNSLTRACLWHGSSSSFVDLHALLPPYYYSSEATGVQGKTVYGWALQTGYWVAVTWQLP